MNQIKSLLFLLILPSIVFAKDIKIEHLNYQYNIIYWLNNYSYSINNNAKIDTSFSMVNKGCAIELNYTNKPVLMKTKRKDIEFTYLHEISHCILGKEVFYQPIDWVINISKGEKQNIEKIIQENEKFYLKNSKTPLIKVIYHEIFADTLSSILYIRENENAENDIKYLIEKRMNHNKNIYDSHLSVSALELVLKQKEEIKQLTIDKLKDKAIKITQEKLLDYIRAEYE